MNAYVEAPTVYISNNYYHQQKCRNVCTWYLVSELALKIMKPSATSGSLSPLTLGKIAVVKRLDRLTPSYFERAIGIELYAS